VAERIVEIIGGNKTTPSLFILAAGRLLPNNPDLVMP
jgi:hypothetical protein